MRRAIENAVEDCYDINNFDVICSQTARNYANTFDAHWSQMNDEERAEYDAQILSGGRSFRVSLTGSLVNEEDAVRSNNSQNILSPIRESAEEIVPEPENNSSVSNNIAMAHGSVSHTPSRPSVFTRVFTNSNRRRSARSSGQSTAQQSGRTLARRLEVRDINSDVRQPFMCTRSRTKDSNNGG